MKWLFLFLWPVATFAQSQSRGGSQWTTSGSNIYKNNAGNVGIGPNNPATILDVQNSSSPSLSGNEVLRLRSNYVGGGDGVGGYLTFTDTSGTVVGRIYSFTDGNDSIGLDFSSYASGLITNALHITGAGLVLAGSTLDDGTGALMQAASASLPSLFDVNLSSGSSGTLAAAVGDGSWNWLSPSAAGILTTTATATVLAFTTLGGPPKITGTGGATFDFGVITAFGQAEQAVACAGASVGDGVIVMPQTAPATGINPFGYVKTSGTVTLRVDPPVTTSGSNMTWKVLSVAHP